METPPEQLQPCAGEGEPVAKMIKGLEAGVLVASSAYGDSAEG